MISAHKHVTQFLVDNAVQLTTMTGTVYPNDLMLRLTSAHLEACGSATTAAGRNEEARLTGCPSSILMRVLDILCLFLRQEKDVISASVYPVVSSCILFHR